MTRYLAFVLAISISYCLMVTLVNHPPSWLRRASTAWPPGGASELSAWSRGEGDGKGKAKGKGKAWVAEVGGVLGRPKWIQTGQFGVDLRSIWGVNFQTKTQTPHQTSPLAFVCTWMTTRGWAGESVALLGRVC